MIHFLVYPVFLYYNEPINLKGCDCLSTTTTKRALAQSLKQKLKEKPLDKITVKDICEDCEVNRQTFYYHFQDIYDLIEWIYTNEADQALDGKKTYTTWEEGLAHIFSYALEEREFVSSTYHSLSREHLEQFLFKETYRLLYDVIDEMCHDISIKEEDKVFIADFYKYAFVGIVLDWVRKGMKEDPTQIIHQLKLVLEGNIANAIHKCSQIN